MSRIRAYRAARWAHRMLRPNVAVILDTETTGFDGSIIEISVISASDGAVLLNTLVDAGVPIEAGARAVHGICDADVVGAPVWGQVLPRLLAVTRGRKVLAYNADYDRDRILGDCRAAQLDAAHLARSGSWGCIMIARSARLRISRYLRLDGGHRALGDCVAARKVLLAIASSGSSDRRAGDMRTRDARVLG